jgi:hypothetical protein
VVDIISISAKIWLISGVFELELSAHLAIGKKAIVSLRDLDFWTVGQQGGVKCRECFGPGNFPFL